MSEIEIEAFDLQVGDVIVGTPSKVWSMTYTVETVDATNRGVDVRTHNPRAGRMRSTFHPYHGLIVRR